MAIKIKYFAQIRQVTDIEEEILDSPDPVGLKDMLVRLTQKYGEKFKDLLFEKECMLRPSVLVLINGVVVPKGELPEIHDKDEVTLITAVAGG